MIRGRRDLDDDLDDDFFDRSEEEDRRRRRDESIERNARIAAVEAEQDAKRMAEIAERGKHARGRELINAYHAAGVSPPHVDSDGYPTTSLSLLLRMGWIVETVFGEKTLTNPGAKQDEYPLNRD